MDEFSSSPTNNEFSSSPPPEFSSSPPQEDNTIDDDAETKTSNENNNNDDVSGSEWVAYQDENGKTYYHNSKTGESSWALPEAAAAVEVEEEEVNDGNNEMITEEGEQQQEESSLGGGEIDSTNDNQETHEEEEQDQQQESSQAEWVAYTDDEGREYYYNATTGATQWDKPDDVEPQSPPIEELEQQESETKENEEETETIEEEEINPIKKAEEFLSQPDAILEQNCIQNVSDLVTNLGPEIGGPKAMQLLTSSFHGYTAICGQLALWLAKLSYSNKVDKESSNTTTINTSISTGISSAASTNLLSRKINKNNNKLINNIKQPTRPTPTKKAMLFTKNDAANIPRKIAENIIQKISIEKFTKQSGDTILKLSKQEAMFLEAMCQEPCWRSLLIDLASKYSDSALLMYCLQNISKKGYHREITKRVKGSTTSDYFVVFNAMLMSELVVLGKMAVGGSVVDEDVLNIGMDVKRSCGSTSYTFIYTLELLEELIQKASIKCKTEKTKQNHRTIGLSRAIRKWERFKEDLIDSMVVDSSSSSSSFTLGNDTGASSSITPMIKKRKVDVTLCVMDFYQHDQSSTNGDNDNKRIKTNNNNHDNEIETESLPITNNDGNNNNNSKLHSALLCLLKNYAYSKTMDTSIANQLLTLPSSSQKQQEQNDNEEEAKLDNNESKIQLSKHYHKVGKLLTNNPSAIISLLGNLFKVGSFRLRAIDDRNHCAKLIALSVIASKRQLLFTCADDDDDKEEGEEDEDDTKANDNDDEELEINHLCDVLIKGCVLTEKLENMVGFTASDDSTTIQPNTASISKYLPLYEKMSPGRQLTFLVKHNPVVAQGVLIWSIDLSHGRDFVTSAAYPTLAPSLLSLIRIMSIYHPFSRQVVLQLTLTFLHHSSNKELSYAKAHAIKQQALRLLLVLCTQGLVLGVLCSITHLVDASSSVIDSALLRYFIKGCLDIILPPISLPLVRVMGKLLLTKLCKESLCSSYFEQMPGDEVGTKEHPRFPKSKTAKDQLMRFVGFMSKCVEEEKKFVSNTAAITDDDESMMSILISIYDCR